MSNPSSKHYNNNFAGIWRSRYKYFNTVRGKDMNSDHYIRIYPRKMGLIVESIPDHNKSYLLARFSLDKNIITGTFQEITSPEGDFKGEMYFGAGQLILSDDGKEFVGMYVGYTKKVVVKAGPWTFTYLGDDESAIVADKKKSDKDITS